MASPKELISRICEVGRRSQQSDLLAEVSPFRRYLDQSRRLRPSSLSRVDSVWTRREIVTRFLLLSSVLDQGPDISGIRILLRHVTNNLYRKGVKFLHKPEHFFAEFEKSLTAVVEAHELVKTQRAERWAREAGSKPSKYNLFMDNTKQALNFVVFRWGVPLSLPLLLIADQKGKFKSRQPLVDYLEKAPSAELMSQMLKDHRRYGLGKAIGDKAAHLFAKWYIHTFRLNTRDGESWGPLSYELPLDSNVGRVLFRTGFWLNWADLKDYKRWNVIQPGKGKGGTHHIRVTNIRGKPSTRIKPRDTLMDAYNEIASKHLRVVKRKTRKVKLQQIPNALLLGTRYSVGDLDDGLIKIGTKYCLNRKYPKCTECPLSRICEGYQNNKSLIRKYRT